MVLLWLLNWSHLRRSCFSSNIEALQINLPVPVWVLWFGRKCTVTTSHLVYINVWQLIEMISSGNLLQISVFNWVGLQMWPKNYPTYITQPHHFAITYLCSYLYTKKLFMRKSHAPDINSCVCIPSEEFLRRFIWTLVKCSSECHTYSITHKSNLWYYNINT